MHFTIQKSRSTVATNAGSIETSSRVDRIRIKGSVCSALGICSFSENEDAQWTLICLQHGLYHCDDINIIRSIIFFTSFLLSRIKILFSSENVNLRYCYSFIAPSALHHTQMNVARNSIATQR